MKFLLFACFITATLALDKAYIEKSKEKLKPIGEKCIGETGATEEDIAQLIAHQMPTTHEGKCMIFCFHKAFNIQTEDGAMNKEGTINSLAPLKAADADLYEKFVQIVNTCSGKVTADADPCITAYNMAECAVNEGKAMGLSEGMFDI